MMPGLSRNWPRTSSTTAPPARPTAVMPKAPKRVPPVCESIELLRFAAATRTPTLLASTSEVYGKGSRTPFAEDDDVVYGPTTLNRWSYACSKAIDEYLALAHQAVAIGVLTLVVLQVERLARRTVAVPHEIIRPVTQGG